MSSNQEKREQLKQQLLDQIKVQQEAIDALSDEELESVAGGYVVNMNTGVVIPHNQKTIIIKPSGVMPRNVNTGVVLPNPPQMMINSSNAKTL